MLLETTLVVTVDRSSQCETVIALLDPAFAGNPKEALKCELRKKLLYRLVHGDRVTGFVRSFKVVYRDFVKANPLWNTSVNPAASLFFETYDWSDFHGGWLEQSGFLVIRRQTYRHCYRHAVVTLMHYHIVINSRGQRTPMVDVSMSEGDRKGDDLFEFLKKCGGTGGFSTQYLFQCMVEAGDVPPAKGIDQILDIQHVLGEAAQPAARELQLSGWMDAVATYPLLLSEFRCEQRFSDDSSKVVVFHGRPTTPFTGECHSMVVIGMRQDTSSSSSGRNSYFFLLQNTHRGKHLVECSAEYLAACSAKVTRVANATIQSFPDTLHYHNRARAVYESCVADEEASMPEAD